MKNIINIVAIPGSTRLHSSNLSLINAIAGLYKDDLNIKIYTAIQDIPHFNPDHDNDTPPLPVAHFRSLIKNADGILICTPEYAMGVPGTLKNAIDWTVSSMEFSHKPVALITASSSGRMAHASLIETLLVIESDMPAASQLLISFIKTKTAGNSITDMNTLTEVKKCIDSLIDCINKNSNNLQ